VLDIFLRIENVCIKTLLLCTFSPDVHIRIVSAADDQSLTRTCIQSYRWYEHLNCTGFFGRTAHVHVRTFNDISALCIEVRAIAVLNLIHTQQMIII
jgi:hypothetical protein